MLEFRYFAPASTAPELFAVQLQFLYPNDRTVFYDLSCSKLSRMPVQCNNDAWSREFVNVCFPLPKNSVTRPKINASVITCQSVWTPPHSTPDSTEPSLDCLLGLLAYLLTLVLVHFFPLFCHGFPPASELKRKSFKSSTSNPDTFQRNCWAMTSLLSYTVQYVFCAFVSPDATREMKR